jgi:hypothetical protein
VTNGELVRVSDADRERTVASLREHLERLRPGAPLIRVDAIVAFGGRS